jgi:serine/threonine protein kinase
LHLAIGIVRALGKAHQRGLVHKDVKPANILVNGANAEARLTGFGIASRLPPGGKRPSRPRPSLARSPTWPPNRPGA